MKLLLFLEKNLLPYSCRVIPNGALSRVPLIKQSVLRYLVAYLHV